VDIDDQQVPFSFLVNSTTLFVTAIYASTSNFRRKELWVKFNLHQSQNNAPSCFIGDFNTLLGTCEHNGSFSSARPPMLDFQNWTDTFDL